MNGAGLSNTLTSKMSTAAMGEVGGGGVKASQNANASKFCVQTLVDCNIWHSAFNEKKV